MVREQKGFTLVEMLIVLLIISVLILITIPNVTKHFASIDDKGCSAYVSMVQGQVEAYRVDKMKYPTIEELIAEKYISGDEAKCPSGERVIVEANGNVKIENASNKSDSSSKP